MVFNWIKEFNWIIFVKAMYFMLPAYAAVMIPSLLRKMKFLSTPVDFGKNLKKRRIFGQNKTWKGIILAPIAGLIIFWVQKLLFPYLKTISLIDYSAGGVGSLELGVLLGIGAAIGSLANSFFKRRVGIKAGKSWPVLDQIDFVVGALLFAYIVYIPPFVYVIAVLVVSPILYIISTWLGYALKINKNKW